MRLISLVYERVQHMDHLLGGLVSRQTRDPTMKLAVQ